MLLLTAVAQAQISALPDTVYNPNIDYNTTPKQYIISGITVTGAPNFDENAVIGYSGLDVGRTIGVPGEEITAAVKRFVKQGLFSDIKIAATKTVDNRIWLEIRLKERPRVSELNFFGLKKSEKEDAEKSIGIIKDSQITPNIADRAEKIVKKHLASKGFSNAEVKIYQKDDPEKPGFVIVDVNVDKKEKVKVNRIFFTGNTVLNQMKLDNAMKKTNEKGKWYNFFKSKKFIPEEFQNDKNLLVERYNDAGFRDAYIAADSVVHIDDKTVNIYISIEEGEKYYFGNINWVGNTVYMTQDLNQLLKIQKGEVYNHKLLNDRLQANDDAVSKLYTDRGYLFAHIEPVEVSVNDDSINFEMRIFEGKQATINKIGINGNERVNEHVIRRELYTKPGQLYSQTDIVRSLGELARMGHFDPESVYKNIDIQPDPENGTVDINYGLTTKSSDQIEFSAGIGGTGFVGSIGLKFTNFAIQNILKPKTYHFVPQGEGQTFTLNYRSSGLAYNSFSVSFIEPWLGGKRPNSLSVSFYFAQQNSYSNRFLNNMSSYYNSYLYQQNSVNNIYGYDYSNYGQSEYDPGKYIRTFVGSIGYGKRLKWPDDYFTFYGELSYQLYSMSKWPYMGLYEGSTLVQDGVFHNPSITFALSRSSVMNPIYPRSGSTFTLSLKLTPPYSLINGKDYTKISFAERYRFIEYHKWKFSAKTFTPLDSKEKFVLMTRAEFGYLGHYNDNARSPFETFMLGGDGMSAYSGAYTLGMEYIPLRGYDAGAPYTVNSKSQSSATSATSYLYNKFTLEARYPISLEQNATIYALAFVEAGNSFFSIKDYNPFNLSRSAGVGVRIFLPMFGILGIDWAYGFDKTTGTTKASGSHFHFVLGQEL
jgi:outer membrane protein insertion porin family